MTPHVALAGCREWPEAGPSDLYPDADAAPLEAALRDLGATATRVAWDDPQVMWGSCSHVFVSSTWDSVDRPAEYLAWARGVSAETTLVNTFGTIEWGLDKIHQRQLAAAGIPVIPTTWVRPGGAWKPEARGDFVVKPSVSAGGRSTARYAPGDPAAASHVRNLQHAGQTVMVQDYLSSIDADGEVNLIFFDGRFSHAVSKKPLLQVGQGVIERPWEKMAWNGLVEPAPEQLLVAERTMHIAGSRIGEVPVYGRVDLVGGPGGRPLVLEVELVDPYLSLDLDADAAPRLAAAVLRR